MDDNRVWVKKKNQRSLADLSVNRVIIVAGLWPCIVFLKTFNELQCHLCIQLDNGICEKVKILAKLFLGPEKGTDIKKNFESRLMQI